MYLRLQACSTLNADPLEPVNRTVWEFNAHIADIFGQTPGYAGAPQDFIVTGLSNITGNLREPLNFANALLQGRDCAAGVSLRRFLTNSTLGAGGLFDVAKTQGGISEYRTGFGETLGVWGASAGPYAVLPLFGPTNARGISGTAIEFAADPMSIAASRLGSVSVDAALMGLQVAGEAIAIDEAGTGSASSEQSDPYVMQKLDFERAQQKALAGYACPDALKGAFWSPKP